MIWQRRELTTPFIVHIQQGQSVALQVRTGLAKLKESIMSDNILHLESPQVDYAAMEIRRELDNIANVAIMYGGVNDTETAIKALHELEEHLHNYRVQLFKEKAFQQGEPCHSVKLPT